MIWIGFSAMWVSISVAVIYTINTTGRITPLWAFIIPLFISFSTEKKNEDKE